MERPELIIGLVGAVGSPLAQTAKATARALTRFGYSAECIKLSDLLKQTREGNLISRRPEHERLKTAMGAGTELRKRLGRGDALVAIAAAEMNARRREARANEEGAGEEEPLPRTNHAFVLNSLKHQHEVARLRALYRDQFVLLGVYSPKTARVQALAERFADSEGGKSENYRKYAEELIAIDESEEGTDLGQSVRKVFPLADAFVAEGRVDEDVERTLALLFGAPYETPSKDEQGMFFAQAAALRSAALARQVGACITNQYGDVLAVGCNEVPRAGGGQYWPGDEPDGRDFSYGHDRNDRLKLRLLREILSEIKTSNWVVDSVRNSDLDQLLGSVLSKNRVEGQPWLRETRVGSLTEFGRDVHAEMAALLALARGSVSAAGATLYTTTFPCHNCAKHILAAGITRVVFIEPYPESFAVEFHAEAFSLEGAERDMSCGRVTLQPFSGVAPRKYLQWFQARKRKGDDGTVVEWPAVSPLPAFVDPELGGYDQANRVAERDFIQQVLPAALRDTEQAS